MRGIPGFGKSNTSNFISHGKHISTVTILFLMDNTNLNLGCSKPTTSQITRIFVKQSIVTLKWLYVVILYEA